MHFFIKSFSTFTFEEVTNLMTLRFSNSLEN